ncbi:hypothetical protein [Marinovum sp.]|uniref:hypothetical protein n=1 Tax=Marinovum sp. TaxID=2024839 RepID=UPI002B2657C3|nr:hypothetical protein [Marinovum sp.]
MTTKRLRSLSVMERVKELETREQAGVVGALRARFDTLEQERAALLARLFGESHIDGLEGAPYLGRFIASIRAELERNGRETARLTPDLAAAEEKLRAALSEQKTFEILRLSTLRRQRKEAARRAAAAQDLQTLQRWTRDP